MSARISGWARDPHDTDAPENDDTCEGCGVETEDMGDVKNVWNPRFLKYCESIRKKPEEVNSDTMPGWTIGFDEWLKQKMGEFAQVKLEAFYHGIYGKTLIDHKAFDEWLKGSSFEITATVQKAER